MALHQVLILGSGPAGYTAAIYAAPRQPQAADHPRPAARRPAHDHHRGRELPRLRRGHHGPRADGGDARSRRCASAPSSSRRTVDEGRLLRGARSRCGPTTAGVEEAEARHRRHRRLGAAARHPDASRSSWASACRRARPATASSSRSRRCRGRRRRHRDGGGELPDALLRARSSSCTAATSCAPRRSCRSARRRTRRSASSGTREVVEVLGEARAGKKVTGVKLRDTQDRERCTEIADRRRLRRHRPPAQHALPARALLDIDETGYMRSSRAARARTSTGVFAAGDVADTVYRQAVTAAGIGLHGRDRRRALARSAGHADALAAHAAAARGASHDGGRDGTRSPRIRRAVRRRRPGRASPARSTSSNLIEQHNAAVAAGAPRAGARRDHASRCSRSRRAVGAHGISGAVMDPRALRELMPDWREQGCPVDERGHRRRRATSSRRAAQAPRLPIMPPPLDNHGNYVVSLGDLVRVDGATSPRQRACCVATETPAAIAARRGRPRSPGVRTGDKGIDKHGREEAELPARRRLRARRRPCCARARAARSPKQLERQLGLDRAAATRRSTRPA